MTNANEDIDTDINDDGEDLENQEDTDNEEEFDDDSDEDESEDTSDDSTSDEEDEDESGDVFDDDDGSEEDPDLEARKQRKQTTIDRLKKERDEWKQKATGKKPEAKSSKGTPDAENHALLARLESRGVMHPVDQSYVIKFARAEKISPIEALKDQVVIDRLASNKEARLKKKSTPVPSNRTGKVTKNIDYFIRKGTLPSDPELAEKVQDEMARRAKAGR